MGIEIENFSIFDFYKLYKDSFSLQYKFDKGYLNSFLMEPLEIIIENDRKEFYWGYVNLSLKKHGFGINITPEGDLHLGNFKNDKYNGKGIFLFNTKDKINFIKINIFNNSKFHSLNILNKN